MTVKYKEGAYLVYDIYGICEIKEIKNGSRKNWKIYRRN